MFRIALLALVLAIALPAKASEKVVESINPLWMSAQVRAWHERGLKSVALSMCGQALHSCTQAAEKLRTLTAQCSSTLLGTINTDEYWATSPPFGAPDPELILLVINPETEQLTRVNVMATVNPDTVAIVLCPKESRSFGHALRMLEGLTR